MTELQSIFLTAGLTIFGGVIIYVVGQWINNFVINPYVKYKEIVGKIIEELGYYGNIYTNPGPEVSRKEEYNEASISLRRVACQFMPVYNALGCKMFLKVFKFIPDEIEKNEVQTKLIFLSNILWDKNYSKIEDIIEREKQIEKLLLKKNKI